MSRLRSLLVNLAVLAGAFLVLALLLELALALTGINTRSNMRYIPGKGITYLPGAWYVHSKEGASSGYFNSHGFRDRPRTWDKPPGVTRILVLGDSYTEGMQVPLDRTFPALMEDELNGRAGREAFEVLNLGQSGFGTADAYRRYLDFGLRYDPDIVLLALFSGNDIRNNHKELNLGRPAFYYRLTPEGGVELDLAAWQEYEEGLTFLHRAFQQLKRRSYLASLISERLYLLRMQDERRAIEAGQEDLGPAGVTAGEQGSADAGPEPMSEYEDASIYRVPLSSRWAEAFAITEGLLRLFQHSVEKDGARFVLVTFPNAEVVHPELQRFVEARWQVDLDFNQPERLLGDMADRLGLLHLSLQPGFVASHVRTGQLLHGFNGAKMGHWNEAGHALAAGLILEYLTDSGLTPAAENAP